ncbi:MAG TPA: VCBS repeat-containing protein [Sphingomicrobium sp.]
MNGDGREDILLTADSGLEATVLFSLLQTASAGFQIDQEAATLIDWGWSVVGTGDFNGDGKTDVLLRGDNGAVTDWLIGPSDATIVDVPDAPFIKESGFHIIVPNDWHVVGTGDFNGDGYDDILWRSDAGTVREWLGQADGLFHGNVANLDITVPTDWNVAGIADFNGDGYADILWRSDAGTVRDWLGQADGGFHGNVANLNITVPLDWRIAATGDYNGDGYADILWRDNDGTLRDWLGQANGTFVGNVANLNFNPGENWQVQPNPAGYGLWDY